MGYLLVIYAQIVIKMFLYLVYHIQSFYFKIFNISNLVMQALPKLISFGLRIQNLFG